MLKYIKGLLYGHTNYTFVVGNSHANCSSKIKYKTRI